MFFLWEVLGEAGKGPGFSIFLFGFGLQGQLAFAGEPVRVVGARGRRMLKAGCSIDCEMKMNNIFQMWFARVLSLACRLGARSYFGIELRSAQSRKECENNSQPLGLAACREWRGRRPGGVPKKVTRDI